MSDNNETVGVRLLANQAADDRHEDAVNKFASVIQGCMQGYMALAELKHVKSGELEYFVVGVVKLEGDEENYHYIPVARLLDSDEEAESYMLPDLEGGWVGEVKDDEETTDDHGAAEGLASDSTSAV